MHLLLAQIKSGEIRDVESSTEARKRSAEFGQAVVASWQQPHDAVVMQFHDPMLQMVSFPEFSSCAFLHPELSVEDNVLLACARAQVANIPHELPLLVCASLRAFTNDHHHDIANVWASLLTFGDASPVLLRLCLQCLAAVLPCSSSRPRGGGDFTHQLLTKRLLPLHLKPGKLSPTQSLLEAFHADLTLCVAKACSRASSSWDVCFQQLTSSLYPAATEGNSPKEVLILHELETLLGLQGALSNTARACICTRLLSCISSLHGVVCERALCFWQSPSIFAALQAGDGLLSRMCDGALAKASLEHWSVTVRSMAGAALLVSRGASGGAGGAGASSPLMDRAVDNARQVQLDKQRVPDTMPLPKTFSSSSVIRDALEPFASGAFGVIWRGRAIVPGVGRAQWPLVALKEVDCADMARAEMEAMARIGPHANLVALLGTYGSQQQKMHLVLELVEPPPGDLHTVVCERTSLSLDLTRWFGAQLGSAVAHVHARGYVFGDIKPENVLVTRAGVVKLCDFGSCFAVAAASSSNQGGGGGTIEYMAPEQVPGVPADWWAFGCVLHFMSTGRPPVFFATEEDTDLPSAFTRAVTFADQRGGVLIKDNTLRSLVAALCSRDPAARPLADGGESHAFFHQARPWSSLAVERLGEYPGLPKPVATSSAAAAATGLWGGGGGPWQRRTFSMIHSPMPKPYQALLDPGFVQRALGHAVTTVPLADCWILQEQPDAVLARFETAMTRIPARRTPCENLPDGSNAAAATATGAGAARARRTANRSYNVGGLDLTAG